MEVYCVFQGCYSDRNCVAVFDNKEKAEKYSMALNCEDYPDVEEFELNQYTEKITQKKVKCWYATIWLKNISGYFAGVEREHHKQGEMEECERDCIVSISDNERCRIEKNRHYIQVTSFVSAEHAKKVAIEQYQIYTQQKLEDGEL